MIMAKDSHGNYVKIEDIKQQDSFNGISPIDFKSNGDNLKNYRIYGDTVNEESVGDLIIEGEHSGEYQVSVTIEGKNLLSQLPSSRENKGIIFTNENNYIHIEGTSTGGYAQTTDVTLSLSEGTYYASFVCSNEIDKSKMFGVIRHYDNSDITNVFSNGSKFTISEPETVRIIIGVIYANSTVNTNLYFQIEKNFIKTSYEPYHAPVTTNLYLPEQIKMVGDEAEYIDYSEQKQYFADGTNADVTLPALPTLSGTNVLSVDTNIKPSKVWGNMDEPKDILFIKNNLGNILFSKYNEIEEKPPLTFKGYSKNLKNYRIYGNTVNGENVGDLVESGEHAGEYLVPVTVTNGTDTETTNLYLPEQIKKVGDESEYIDFKEQKQYRVRKNLLQNTATSQTINGVTFTVNSDGSVTCNGTAGNSNTYYTLNTAYDIYAPNGCIINGVPNGSENTFWLQVGYVGNTFSSKTFVKASHKLVYVQIVICANYTCDNLTFYPMIRKADISDNTYEPYITNTESNVALPSISVPAGINTLSVETEVQPSNIYLKGKIEKKPKIYYYSDDR